MMKYHNSPHLVSEFHLVTKAAIDAVSPVIMDTISAANLTVTPEIFSVNKVFFFSETDMESGTRE